MILICTVIDIGSQIRIYAEGAGSQDGLYRGAWMESILHDIPIKPQDLACLIVGDHKTDLVKAAGLHCLRYTCLQPGIYSQPHILSFSGGKWIQQY